MLTLFLSLAIIAQAPAPADVDAGRCQAKLAARAGEISTFEVTRRVRHGATRELRGTLTAQQRPPTAPPGMMTAMHIINARFDFRCTLRAGKVVRARLSPAAT